MTVSIAVVDADTPGNVGTIARAMKNFGFEDLLLVDPPELDPDSEAYGYAGQAREDVLPNARELRFEDLVAEYHTIGFTAITNENGAKHVRYPFTTPAELADDLAGGDRQTTLVFGRERVGLTNDELARLDRVCSIPAAAEYPSLNLGQAATIALYELRDLGNMETQLPDRDADRATPAELERFIEHVESFLGDLDYPAEKRPKTMRLVRRLFGRARPTGRELRSLRGLFRRASQRLDRELSGQQDRSE